MNPAERALAGLRVLVCRPEHQGRPLQQALEAAGAQTHCLPLIEIHPLPEDPHQRAILQDLDHFQHIIPVSANAAEALMARVDRWWPQLPTGIHWYALGEGTARPLRQAGIEPIQPASGHDSEALLTLPQLQEITCDRVLIARGQAGRERLPQTLEARGARVTRLALYERRPARPDTGAVQQALVHFCPQVIVALSAETLNNLAALGQNTDSRLFQRQVLVPTERVASEAARLGFARSLVPERLDADGIRQFLQRARADNRIPE